MDLTNKKIVVTGGAGFIGSHLVRALQQKGAQVTVLDNLKYGRADALGKSVHLLQCDFAAESQETLVRHLNGAALLFHLAAEKHNQSIDDPELVFAVNVDGSRRLFNAAKQAGVGRVVFSSSLYAYGRMHLPPMREDEIPQPHTAYGQSKLQGEALLQECGISHAILRLFFTYGPSQYPGMGYKSVIVKNFERILNQEAPVIFGDGQQALDYLHVDDVVRALLLAGANTHNLLINAASGNAVSIRELTQQMLAVSGSSLQPVFAAADWTAGSVRVGDPACAKEQLGWQCQVPLARGLETVYSWLRKSEFS